MNRSPGRRDGHFLRRARDRFGRAAELDGELEVGPQTGRVRHQVMDGDGGLAVLAELRNERGDADRSAGCRPCSTSCITLVVVATTLVSEARSKIVSSVIASRAGCDGAIAEGRVIHDLVAASDQHDGARQLFASDRRANEAADRRQIRRTPGVSAAEARRRAGRRR